MPRSCLPLSLAVALSSVPARAADLLQIYRDALANDATYASARATRDAGLESLPQGLAPILPTVNATAFTQDNRNNISFRGAAPDSQRQGNSNGFTVTLTQPLFNWQNIQAYKEAGFKAAQAEATFGQATQDLIVRVAQAYFDVLASQDSLAFIQGQKVAISEQLAQAKRNFEVGTATITDTHEPAGRTKQPNQLAACHPAIGGRKCQLVGAERGPHPKKSEEGSGGRGASRRFIRPPVLRWRHQWDGPGESPGGGARFQPQRARFEQARLRGRGAHQHRRLERPATGLQHVARSFEGAL